MKRARCIGLLGLVLASLAVLTAQEHSASKTRRNRFSSTDGMFQFEYPASLVRCVTNQNQREQWAPQESCEAYTPVCSDFSCKSDGTVACIAYPAEGMKGTDFQAAAFAVSEQKALTTKAECLKVEEPPPHTGDARKERVNGVIFTVVETDGVAAGNLIDGFVYRTFHGSKCYELDIRVAYSNPANTDPGAMKDFDIKAVHRRLKQVLDTFKFVK